MQYNGAMFSVAYLKEHATNSPHVHLVSVVAICQQALWGSVPAGGDVLCVRLLGVDAPTAAKVCQLQTLVYDQDVLRLDVPAPLAQCRVLPGTNK